MSGKANASSFNINKSLLDRLASNIVSNSAIEEEHLNAHSVRSSVAKRLNIVDDVNAATTKKTENLADIVHDIIHDSDSELTLEKLLDWHSKLFCGDEQILNPIVGGQLRENGVEVVSNRGRSKIVHFKAPSRDRLGRELESFIDWFNQSRNDKTTHPFVRAAIAQLYFLTIHPFEDGNGRLSRFITDLVFAQHSKDLPRLQAMSNVIESRRKSYYEVLETTQKGGLDITNWIVWFLETLNASFDDSTAKIEMTLEKTRFWQDVDQTKLCTEQVKVLNRMLDGNFKDGIKAKQYRNLTKTSTATASRHLSHLVELGCLVKVGNGCVTRYRLQLTNKD